MKNGGKREGSGRKPGVSKATLIKRKIAEYFTEKDVIKLIADAKRDPKLKAFFIEQLFGKAPQRLEMTGLDGEPILIQISSEIAAKNNVPTSSTKSDS